MKRWHASRPLEDPALVSASADERRRADLFFRDLFGPPASRRRPYRAPARAPEVIEVVPTSSVTTREDVGLTEVVPRGGRGAFRHVPLGGDPGDNVGLRFNVDASTAAGATVDVVVHLHGFGAPGAAFLARKVALAGVELVNAAGTVTVRASRPTLAIVPRGRNSGGNRWSFDNLPDRAAFDALVEAAFAWLATALGLAASQRLARGRLTLLAHSGGGAGMAALLAGGVDPDEVVCLDSLYGNEPPVRRWMEAKVASAAAARGGLRAFYTPCHAGSWSWQAPRWLLQSTEVSARRLQHAIDGALAAASGGAALAARFRVERTSVPHNDVPARYTPLLLDDIAATVPNAFAPPPVTSRPACAANADWLTRPAQRPGGDAPPGAPAAPRSAPAPAREDEALAVEDDGRVAEATYDPPSARAFTPSASAALFRTPPSPVAVDPAAEWPESTNDPDAASRAALRTLGVSAAGVTGYDGAGLAALRPTASAFGEAALTELLRRLRYSAARLARPPHSYDNEAQLTAAFGRAVPRPVLLGLRVLLAVPGHFRQLARRAGSDAEAFALENLGWLLMQSLRDEVRQASGLDFWLPASPPFVTPFANPVAALGPQVSALVVRRLLIDTTLAQADYTARFASWRDGAPGRAWRLETGRETVPGRVAAAPFYPDLFANPAGIDISAQRAQVAAAWSARVAAFDRGNTTVALTTCDNTHLRGLGVMGPISLEGLQLRAKFPAPANARALTSLNGLAAVRPAFEAAFKAVADLGWNDLLFETQGMGCFRGTKIPGNPAAARTMSNHSLGIAVDLNAFENTQNTTGSMDPRIVALFEAFRFRWGRSFTTPDPMHFDYAG